jgi:hypothetical protein
VIAHRDVHGLAEPASGDAARGDAYGRVAAARLARLSPAERARAAARESARGALTLAWRAAKQRGRLTSGQRALAGGVVRGAAAGLSEALR